MKSVADFLAAGRSAGRYLLAVSSGIAMLGAITEPMGQRLSVETMLGWLMTPLALLMGIPWSEAAQAGQLIGIKTVLNELLAYVQLASLSETAISDRSRLILTYALCGFANFGSLGIMIGGLGGMAPDRRDDIVKLGARSILAGTLGQWLNRSGRAQNIMNRMAGAVFLGLALKLAVTQR